MHAYDWAVPFSIVLMLDFDCGTILAEQARCKQRYMKRVNRLGNSITKVWSIILVLAFTFLGLSYWGFKSYRNSAAALQRIVLPDKNTSNMGLIYNEIVQSDLFLNNFFLTGDSTYWNKSQLNDNRVDSLVNALENNQPDIQPSIDTLKNIIKERNRIGLVLFNLKRRQGGQFFTEQALVRINKQLSDSASIDWSFIRKQELVAKRDTIERMAIRQVPREGKGINKYIWRIFGIEKLNTDTVRYLDESLRYSLESTVDSSVVREYFVDTTVANVKGILGELLSDELRVQKRMRAAELQLISYDEMLVDNIKSLLDRMAVTYQQNIEKEREAASAILQRSHIQAFAVAGLGLLIGSLLLFVLIKDLTKSNTYRRELEEERDKARELAQAKEIFLSRMSHEIRTPLHTISGYTQLLSNESLNSKQASYVAGMRNANNYLNLLLDNILEQAKINAGTFRIAKSALHMPTVGQELEQLFSLKQQEQGNAFTVACHPALAEVQVETDGIKVRQILINLLSNAFKFTANGKVSLQMHLIENQQGNSLIIQVSDTGIGISTDSLKSIFLPFSRANQAGMLTAEGTGLGLSISKYIAEHLGGTLEVASTPGKGSTFTLSLPVKLKPYKAESAPVATDEMPFFPIRVLAVEDDAWNRHLLEQFLGSQVLQLHICETAEDAMAYLVEEKHEVDLLLTDLNLPGMSGESLIQRLLPLRKLPSIAMSAGLQHDVHEKLLEMGFTDSLGKPFDAHALLKTIGRHFKKGTAPVREQGPLQPDFSFLTAMFTHPKAIEENKKQFSQSVREKITAFEQVCLASDASEIKRLAHQLKSGLEQVNISNFSEDLQTIELKIELQRIDDAIELAKSILPSLKAIMVQL